MEANAIAISSVFARYRQNNPEQTLVHHLNGDQARFGSEPGFSMKRKIPNPTSDDRIPVEKVLIRMLQTELAVKKISLSDHFSELGGNSFHAIRMIARIFDAFGVRLPLDTFFTARTLQEVVHQIEAKVLSMVCCLSYEAIDAIWDGASRKKIVIQKDLGFDLRHPDAPPEALAPAQLVLNGAISNRRTLIPKRRSGDEVHMTEAQKQIWYHTYVDPGSPAFNHAFAWRLEGWVDSLAVESAFRLLIRRHEILRTSFHNDEGSPIARVLPGAIFNLETVSFPECPDDVLQRYVSSWMKTQTQIPFCLSKPPLLRARLVKLAKRKHVLFVVGHRMIFDQWSVPALARELSIHYKVALEGKKGGVKSLPLQFTDFTAWDRDNQESPALAPQLTYWEQKLANLPEQLDLPYDRTREIGPFEASDTVPLVIDPDLLQSVKVMAQHKNTTVYTVLLAIFKTWLRYYTGQDDIMVGTLTARRARQGTENMLGLLANPIAIRTAFSGHLHFNDILGLVVEETGKAFENSDIAFETVRQKVSPGNEQQPFFQAMYIYRNRDSQLTLGDAEADFMEVDNGYMNTELCLELRETNKNTIEGCLRYNSHLFKGDKARKLADHLMAMINRAVNHRDPNADTGSFSMVS